MLNEIKQALRFVDWNALLNCKDGETFPVLLNGEVVIAEKVHSVDKEDVDYDRDLTVIVRVGGGYYKKHGWSQVGSHCYGEYESSWDSDIEEVTPRTVQVVVWE